MKTAIELIDDILLKFSNMENIIIGKKELEQIRERIIIKSIIPKNKYIIYSTKENFEVFVVSKQDLVTKCKDIWNNPQKYSNQKQGTISSFSEFLQFIKIESSTGETQTILDIIREAR